jgi:hypothetical protein
MPARPIVVNAAAVDVIFAGVMLPFNRRDVPVEREAHHALMAMFAHVIV